MLINGTRPPHMGRQFTRLTLSFNFHTAMGYGSKYFGEGCMLGILTATDLNKKMERLNLRLEIYYHFHLTEI